MMGQQPPTAMQGNTGDRSTECVETPMRDHVARFWRLLATEHVHIVVNMRRDHDEGLPPHWDSASFGDDIAKAVVQQTDVMLDALRRITDECGYGQGQGGDHANDIADAAIRFLKK